MIGPRLARKLAHDKVFAAAVAVLMLLVGVGLGAPWLAPYDPTEQPDVVAGRLLPPLSSRPLVRFADGRTRLAEKVERTPEGLRIERLGEEERYAASEVQNLTADGVSERRLYLLGSDKFGRDVFSRLLYGARVSLTVGVLSVALALTLGVGVGALAALTGGFVDALLMRVVDGLLAFPWFFLLIFLVAVFPSGAWMLGLILGGTSWMPISRIARAEFRGLKERDFIVAVRGLGATSGRVFFRHLLPSAVTPLLVAATLRIGNLILAEALLSFLGFGVQAPQASWGNMIADGRYLMLSAWWTGGTPCLALVVTVMAASLTSDGLRDLLDPREV